MLSARAPASTAENLTACHIHRNMPGDVGCSTVTSTVCACPLNLCCRYEAYELERVQLREGATKHKAEVETLVQDHQAELASVTGAHKSQLAAAQREAAELQRRLEETEDQLAHAQVGGWRRSCKHTALTA